MKPVHLTLYIPSLACACMPGKSDPKAEAFGRLLTEFRDESGGAVSFTVYALNQHLALFRDNPEVSRLLQEVGHSSLPILFVGETLAVSGRYPGKEELQELLRQS